MKGTQRIWIIVCGILAVSLARSAEAQTTQVDRAQLLRSQIAPPFATPTPTGLDDGHAIASPNDPDLGEQQILKRADEYKPFSISVGAPFYWTSNVALVNRGEQDDFLIAPAVGISYAPRITRTLYGQLSVSKQFFDYDRFTGLNFGSFDARAGLTYYLPQWHNLTLHAEYDYNRLTDDDSFDDFFSNHSLIFSAGLPFRIGRAQQLSIGTAVNISVAGEPDPPRRNDYEAYVSYSANLTRAFSVSAAGRVVVHGYYESGRTDVTEILSLSASYRLMKYVSASAISSFAANQSNHSVFDYEVADVGGAVALSISF